MVFFLVRSLLFAAVAIIKSLAFAYSTRPFLAANYVKIIKDPDDGITGITAIALYDYDVSTFLRLQLTLVPYVRAALIPS